MWLQKKITLKPRSRGFHLITDEIIGQLSELKQIETGLAHFFIQHTSASLTINENADATVRADFEAHFNHSVPENAGYYRHVLEGSDDMPAHLKASILGAGVSVPVSSGRLLLGIWQGIYLGEHRNRAGGRRIIATVHGAR
jgi:secondary thiamine-phosphate synthase enzyme